ncbi:MAG: hypothetical protein JW910_12745 [Anaerolineae bacterium]|nr:hypothetical protein [Anaerolineae bacterium]
MTKRYRSTGTTRTVRRRTSSSSRPPSVRRASASWGRGYGSQSYGSSSGSASIDSPGGIIGLVGVMIIAAIMLCSNAGGLGFSSSSSSSYTYSIRATATPVAVSVQRAEVTAQWSLTITTTRPEQVAGHERQADCTAEPDECAIVAETCASETDPATCRMEAIPGTCEEVFSHYSTEQYNCRWQETGNGRWVDVNCRPDPTDISYEVCDQEYQVEEEWVCDERQVAVMQEQCEEREVCEEAVFCDTLRTEQVPAETTSAQGAGPEITPPEVEVPAGGTLNEAYTFSVRIVGPGYDVPLDPQPSTRAEYERAAGTVYYLLLNAAGDPFAHITAAELERGDYPAPSSGAQ